MEKALLNHFLIRNDLSPRAQWIYSASRPVQADDPYASILRTKKKAVLLKKFLTFPSPK
jgi:hypothetical protein